MEQVKTSQSFFAVHHFNIVSLLLYIYIYIIYIIYIYYIYILYICIYIYATAETSRGNRLVYL